MDHAPDFWDLGKVCRIRSITSETYNAQNNGYDCDNRRLGNVREPNGRKLSVPFSIQPESHPGCNQGENWDRRCEENIVWTFTCEGAACEHALAANKVDALEISNLVNKSYTSPPLKNKRIHNGYCNGFGAPQFEPKAGMTASKQTKPGDCITPGCATDYTYDKDGTKHVFDTSWLKEDGLYQCWIPAGLIKRPAVHEGYECSNEDCITILDQSPIQEKHLNDADGLIGLAYVLLAIFVLFTGCKICDRNSHAHECCPLNCMAKKTKKKKKAEAEVGKESTPSAADFALERDQHLLEAKNARDQLNALYA